MVFRSKIVVKSLKPPRFNRKLEEAGMTEIVPPPPSGVTVRPVIVKREERRSHSDVSPMKVNKVPRPGADWELEEPPQLARIPTASPAIRHIASAVLN
jgi:hypothetical protein